MNLVDVPSMAPSTCAVLLIGQSMDTGWIDTGTNLKGLDPRVYISLKGARAVAEFIGWTDPDSRDELDAVVLEHQALIADLQEQLAEADKYISAIDTLEGAGFRQRKKTGRPRKEEVV